MADYLLDTNHASRFLAGAEPLRSQVALACQRGDRFGVSMTVVGELYFAAEASQRREENLRELESFLSDVLVWEFDHEAAREFGRVQAQQKARGKPIPSPDAQIAAVARVHDLTVLTRDHHFAFVEGIRVEDWLAA